MPIYLQYSLLTLLIMSIAIFSGVKTAEAIETGGYPYANAAEHDVSQYVWWVDENGDGQKDVTSSATDNDESVSSLGYYYRNCTDYVAWKLTSLGVPASKVMGLGNGGEWAIKASGREGVTVNQTPAYGAAAVNPNVAAPYGHVSFVDSVDANGVITISEYNFSVVGSYGTRTGTMAELGITDFVHFGLKDPVPDPVPWNFTTLEGDSNAVSPHDADVGRTPDAIEFNGQFYVFHHDANYGDLRVAWTAPTASGWLFDILDGNGGTSGRTTNNVGMGVKAVIYNTQLHVFYYDGTEGALRHAVSADGTSWAFETLDGIGGVGGRTSGNVGQTPTVVVYGTSLQLFYYDADLMNLRHSWFDGAAWYFEYLDGDIGSVAGYNADLGLDPVAAVWGDALRVFYYDSTLTNLRHAWADATGWHFENLDGDAGSVAGQQGKSSDSIDTGRNPTAVVHATTLQLFYYDFSLGNLRHAWADGAGWHFEYLDGDAGSVAGQQGKNGDNTGGTPTALSFSGGLQLFYYDYTGGDLTHAWDGGTGWNFENLDGKGGEPAGRSSDDVGLDPVAKPFGSTFHVLYYDRTRNNLRQAWPQ